MFIGLYLWLISGVPMRIIAGEFRGRALVAPIGDTTRPITDRAKQSLFDALQDCFAGATILDCFAGTGSMGLECLSRGAARAIFIEHDRKALRGLQENIGALGVADRTLVLPIDAYATPATLAGNPDLANLTIAFVDPPYRHTETGHLRQQLDGLLRHLAGHCMVEGGILALRHPTRVSVDSSALGAKIVRELRYGDMAITWLTKS